MEACGEKINVSSGPSKEITGLKKKMKMMMMMKMIHGAWIARFTCVGILA